MYQVAHDTLFRIGDTLPSERIHNWLASSGTFLDLAAEATFLPPSNTSQDLRLRTEFAQRDDVQIVSDQSTEHTPEEGAEYSAFDFDADSGLDY